MLKAISYLLVLIPIFVIVISIFKKTDSFINLGEVFAKHFALFKDCKIQFFIFYVLPLFIATGLMLLYKLSMSFCENINIIASIVLSMLFAICSIIGTKDYSLHSKAEENLIQADNETNSNVEETNKLAKVKKVARETFDAIVVTTFIALVLIFACLSAIAVDVFKMSEITLDIVSSVVYYLLGVTILNLLLIIKRMEKLFIAML